MSDERRCDEELKSELDFSTFILSLGTQALCHLGITEHPVSKTKTVDLALARQFIDIIGMLKEKTHGNLTQDEERLVDTLLFDLRLKYVEVCKANNRPTDNS